MGRLPGLARPGILRKWFGPGGFDVPRVEVEEHVGGRFRIWHSLAGEPAGGFEAELLELVPDERLVFRWGFVGPARDDGPCFDSLLTVTLHPVPEGTRLVLVGFFGHRAEPGRESRTVRPPGPLRDGAALFDRLLGLTGRDRGWEPSLVP